MKEKPEKWNDIYNETYKGEPNILTDNVWFNTNRKDEIHHSIVGVRPKHLEETIEHWEKENTFFVELPNYKPI